VTTYTKTYLGDGAYAYIDEIQNVVITTENGIATTNRIVLGAHELVAFLTFGMRNSAIVANYVAHLIEDAHRAAKR
jgi:hypothetical protein